MRNERNEKELKMFIGKVFFLIFIFPFLSFRPFIPFTLLFLSLLHTQLSYIRMKEKHCEMICELKCGFHPPPRSLLLVYVLYVQRGKNCSYVVCSERRNHNYRKKSHETFCEKFKILRILFFFFVFFLHPDIIN